MEQYNSKTDTDASNDANYIRGESTFNSEGTKIRENSTNHQSNATSVLNTATENNATSVYNTTNENNAINANNPTSPDDYTTSISNYSNDTISINKDELNRFKIIINSASDIITTHKADGTCTYISPSSAVLLGYKPSEVTGHNAFDYIYPDDKQIIMSGFSAMVSGDDKHVNSYRLRKSDGSYSWLETTSSAVRDTEGNLVEVICVSRDITERKNNEQKLEETKRRLVAAQNIAHFGNWELDLKTHMIWGSEEAFSIYGLPPDTSYIQQRKLRDIILPQYLDIINNELSELVQSNKKYNIIYKIRRKNDGGIRTISSHADLDYDEDGNPKRILGIIQDITDQIKSQEDLKEMSDLLNLSQEFANIGSMIYYINENNWVGSPQLYKILGIDNSNECGFGFWTSVIKPEFMEMFNNSFKDFYKNGQFDVEFKIIRKNDNSERWVHAIGKIDYDEQRNPSSIIATIQDITEKKELNDAVKKSLSSLMAILESTADGILAVDKEGNITYFNELFRKMWGIPDDVLADSKDQSALNYVVNAVENPEKFIAKVEKIYNEMDGKIFDEIRLKNGRVFERYSIPHILDGQVIGRVWSFRDISEKKRHEQEILYLGYHDSLTGLYNRRFLDKYVPEIDKPENLPIAVIIGDVNGLKLANDTFGHNTGDLMLIKIADLIKDACGPDDIIVRWGGDEFLIMLPNTDFNEAKNVVRKINEDCIDNHVNSIAISISFGFDIKEHTNQDISKIFKNAEDYMYKHKTVETNSARGKSINMMLNTLYEKNKREEQHSRRVSELCVDIGTVLGLPERVISKLKAIGLLHDIGKIAISDTLLNKPGRLTEDELKEIKRHSAIGYRILNTNSELSEVAEHVLMHHERLDGTGYPNGLKDSDIPLLSRILAVSDTYDAMTSERTYRPALSKLDALHFIKTNSGTKFDDEVVEALIEIVS